MSSEYLTEVIQQARQWDLDRPRSAQREVGWSELAGCRSYIGYRLRGEWASDDEENWRAITGSALHSWMATIRQAMIPFDVQASWEVETRYGGVPGHVDEVLWAAREVTDYKFPSKASARLYQDADVLEEKFIQVQGYAAGLIDDGLEANDWTDDSVTVRLLVAPVDGTFDDWRVYERPFDRGAANDAVERLRYVEDAVKAGDDLPKDKPMIWCERFCEFYRTCRQPGERQSLEITDPEMAAAVEAYGLAHEQYAAADKIKKELAPMIRGLHGTARGWYVGMTRAGAGKIVIDEDAVLRRYEALAERVPMHSVPGAPAKLIVRKEKK